MKKSLYSCLLLLLMFSACNEKEIIIPEISIPVTDKVVLIEEITGTKCVNCPNGARQIKSISEEFKGQVLSIAYHSGGNLDRPYDHSKYDFFIQSGRDVIDYIDTRSAGIPAAAINRRPLVDDLLYSETTSEWKSYVTQELQIAAPLAFTVEKTFNADTRVLNFDIESFFRASVTGNIHITAVVIESHIIDPQLDLGGVVDDYEHNHVARAILTPPNGLPLSQNASEGDRFQKSFSFTLPAEDGWWVAENCAVIYFVHLDDPGKEDGKQILQAGQFYVTE